MPSFKTILFGNLTVEVEIDHEGAIETISDEAGNELEFHDTRFKDEKGEFVTIDNLLYDKTGEEAYSARLERVERDKELAADLRRGE